MNIGIIGCGAISSQYMVGFDKNKNDVNVVACADQDIEKSKSKLLLIDKIDVKLGYSICDICHKKHKLISTKCVHQDCLLKYKYLSKINEKKPFIKIYLLFFNFCILIINKLLLIINHDNRVN